MTNDLLNTKTLTEAGQKRNELRQALADAEVVLEAEVRAAVSSGMSWTAIGKAVGDNKASVWRWYERRQRAKPVV